MSETQGETSPLAVLELRNLCIVFGDRSPVVTGLDLTIHHGKVLGLVGET